MTKQELFKQIKQKKSFLCVGLDTDIKKIPQHLLDYEDPVFEFNRKIIDATLPYCVAYKPNTAFYESMGSKGWETLEKTLNYIPKDQFTVADAKRGDIGNTSNLYARAFFDHMDFDAVTVTPYMGEDSVKPFLNFENKWVILLALTSNAGSSDFQKKKLEGGQFLYEEVITKSTGWAGPDKMMYVVGATQSDYIESLRHLLPDSFFLVPGVGAQGGSLEEVAKYGMNKECGLLVNSSREIIYASDGEDFAEKAAYAAKKIQQQMSELLNKFL